MNFSADLPGPVLDQALYDACQDNLIPQVTSILSSPAPVNVNWQIFGGFSALHTAAVSNHHDVVKLLLARTDIDVNLKNICGWSPLALGCVNGNTDSVKVLLGDKRVLVDCEDEQAKTPLWWAAYYNHVLIVKWLVALRGEPQQQLQDVVEERNEPVDQLGLMRVLQVGEERTWMSAISVAEEKNHQEVATLLRRYEMNKGETYHKVRLELGVTDALVAEMFALVIFVCDDYLRVRPRRDGQASLEQERRGGEERERERERGRRLRGLEEGQSPPKVEWLPADMGQSSVPPSLEAKGTAREERLAAMMEARKEIEAAREATREAAREAAREKEERAIKFFGMVGVMPMELQKMVCNYAYGSPKTSVSIKNSEYGFKSVAKAFATQ